MSDEHKHIPRYTKPDGKKVLVQPPGTPRKMGYQFYHASMAGHVDCKTCGKQLELKEGMPSTVGAARHGFSDYFRVAAADRNPPSARDPEKPKRKSRKINRGKGPVLHINTLEFVPDPDGDKFPLVHPDDLADRERIVIRTVEDLDKYRREATAEKLDDTMVVFKKRATPLVIADHDDPVSLARLNHVLRAEGYDEIPCLLRVTIPTSNTSRMKPNVAMDVDAVAIAPQRPKTKSHNIQLQVFVDERDGHHANWQIFWGTKYHQTYWVMGVARAGERWIGGNRNSRTIYDRINISVTRPDQVMTADRSLAQNARSTMEKRAARTARSPSPE